MTASFNGSSGSGHFHGGLASSFQINNLTIAATATRMKDESKEKLAFHCL